MSKKLVIGMFGFGVVGQGLYDIIKTKDLNLEIKKFVIKNADKKRSLPAELFTTDANVILDDPEINTVVELIDDADAAFEITKRALSTGKNVVSANKKMIATHLEELVEIQHQHGTSLLYEGAVCGSIPIIRNLEEYYDNELLHSVSGIFNGSSNYILSKIFNEGQSYDVALKKAQDLGFAETDPTLDVGGFDPKFKLAIVASHAYGLYINPEEILNLGIDTLGDADIRYAREKDYKIKLIPLAKEIDNKQVVLYVLPKFIKKSNILFNVENEYNGVLVKAAFADEQFFLGKGAGGHPTGSAVLSDITALRYDYRYEYKKHLDAERVKYTKDYTITAYFRYEEEDILENINFINISERFYSENHKYVIGTINIQEIIDKRSIIHQQGNFIAEII
ncbi:homoserine dehydrogenase [Sphingobacterium sp. DK4209]|uniref:Homoserine dehydrogenase n=1 Tax=Sphingobacterium zhuxiongii TaxID=2662364 RepID=A0A5Q0Q8L5_9SPHI|nr:MULTISPECIES: homoserine dehydrogenase [unclassified Sphingobacterium]MVZ64512.1 homoserine dehydrogenase [Sphingobacterium sp. DK4209]QGA25843.1 homoserine dehydrogenase [Sphingobacterium sp. dk4302]